MVQEKTSEKVLKEKVIPKTSIRQMPSPFLDLEVTPPAEALEKMKEKFPDISNDELYNTVTYNYLGMMIEVQVSILNGLADLHLSVIALLNRRMDQEKQTQKILKGIYARLLK